MYLYLIYIQYFFSAKQTNIQVSNNITTISSVSSLPHIQDVISLKEVYYIII